MAIFTKMLKEISVKDKQTIQPKQPMFYWKNKVKEDELTLYKQKLF